MAEVVRKDFSPEPLSDWRPVWVVCVEPIEVGDYLVLQRPVNNVRKVRDDDPVRELVALSGGDKGDLIEAVFEIVEIKRR